MNTLKRGLCAALAFILLLGAAPGAVSVSFTDYDKIVNREAVDLLEALNVIRGKEDGSFFDPKGKVSRAEMAKMICVALNGGRELNPEFLQPSYSDTAVHWAAQYIEHCTYLGIISGRGDGTFDPDAPVTGVEAAKMLLVAIGYRAGEEGFTGPSWAIMAAARAAEKGLFDFLPGLERTAPLSRDDAARMVYSALLADMVAYTFSIVIEDGVPVSRAFARDITPAQSILSSRYRADVGYGVLTSISERRLTVAADPARGQSSGAVYMNAKRDYSHLLGQYVTVIFGGDNEVIGAVAGQESRCISSPLNSVESTGGRVKIGGSTYRLNNGTEGSVTVILDGGAAGSKTAAYFDAPHSLHDVRFVDNNGDGAFEYAVITRSTFAKVHYVSPGEVVAGAAAYRRDSHNIEPGLEAGDYVLVKADLFNDCKTISRIEPVEGTVDAYKSGKTPEYRIGGVWYRSEEALSGISLGDSVEAYAVNGVICFAQMARPASLERVVQVLAIDPPSALTRRAKLLLSDGSEKVVTIDLEDSSALVPDPGGLYTYTDTESSYGAKFRPAVTAGENTYTEAPALSASGGKVSAIGGVPILDSAVIFVWNAGTSKGKVITGKQLKTLLADSAISSAGIGSYTAVVGGLSRVVMAAVAVGSDGVLPEVGNPADKFALILEDAWLTGGGVLTYRVWDGSEIISVTEENAGALAARREKTLIRYSGITGGKIKDAAPAGENRGAVVGLIGSEISFDGHQMYSLTGDTSYLYYDSAAESPAEIVQAEGSLRLADRIEGVCLENVKYVTADGKVTCILIDVNNRLADSTLYRAALTDDSSGADAVFTDAYGNILSTGARLFAGAIVNVTVTGETGESVRLTYTGAVHSSAFGLPYASGAEIVLGAGESRTFTFVISGTASITLQDIQ